MKKEKQVIYYSDELNDEFSKAKIEPRKIDGRFKYNKSAFWEFWSFVFQNILSMPIKYFYLKIKFHHKFVGKEKLKQYKKQGYFVYSNHTQAFSDTFTPSMAVYPKRNFLIVNPANISLKGTGWLVELLGAIPIPEGIEGYKNFLERIQNRIQKGYSVSIYPEAHIWPYYTKIRQFKDVSFKYPVELKTPVFCITNTYQIFHKNEAENETPVRIDDIIFEGESAAKNKNKKEKIQMISYIDGPFFADKSLPQKETQKKLRDEVFQAMTERAKKSNVEKIRFIKSIE